MSPFSLKQMHVVGDYEGPGDVTRVTLTHSHGVIVGAIDCDRRAGASLAHGHQELAGGATALQILVGGPGLVELIAAAEADLEATLGDPAEDGVRPRHAQDAGPGTPPVMTIIIFAWPIFHFIICFRATELSL